MINIIIVDDEAMLSIEKEIILADKSILKNRCKINAFQFAIKIPKNKRNDYTDDKIAINQIGKFPNIDLAFLDIGFPEELEEGEDYYKPISKIIDKLENHHPNCQIVIMSQEQSAREVKYDYPLLGRKFVSASKSSEVLSVHQYNDAFQKILNNRLRYLLNECSYSQKKIIIEYLCEKNNEKSFIINAKEYTPHSLFVQYVNEDKTIDIDKACLNTLIQVIDVPKFEDTHWNFGHSLIKYGLKDYYYQFHKYFSNNKMYSISTLSSNAFESLEILFQYLFKKKISR